MATEITHKRDPLFLSDPMATYNHMEEDQNNTTLMSTPVNSGQSKILWTIVAEEALIAILTLTLLWVSLG